MPSKLRKAIGAVKDQTSISLAKVTNAANLEVVILKATTHDEIPIEECYINEIVSLVSSSKDYAAACAQSIGKRIGKTKSWVVALKSLMIILRIFQDGDPYFPREVLHAMKRGTRILNLSGFRDDSSSSPWEYTAFVRTISLYLDERLDCFLTGKLQRRIIYKNKTPFKNHKMFNDIVGIKDMKPSMLLDKLSYWQRLLDRAMGTRPTGEAKTNRLVQISLYAVVQETFDLYRYISDGLAVILDSFFQLPCKACLSVFQACMKSCKQFDELSDFYSFCLSIGVGRSSEYPKVQKISEELMEALQEFLRDQATSSTNINMDTPPPHHRRHHAQSFSSQYSPLSKHLLVSTLREGVGVSYNSRHDEGLERYGTPEYFETTSEHASSQCTSLEDLMMATDAGILTPTRFEIDYGEQDEKQSENNDDGSSNYESCSNHSDPTDQAARPCLDLVNLDVVQNEGGKEKQRNNSDSNNNASKDCWELVLVETATSTTPEKASVNNNALNSLFDQHDSVPHHQYNPFLELEDTTTVAPFSTLIDQRQSSFLDLLDGEPGFQATGIAVAPMFHGNQNSSEAKVLASTFNAQSSNLETDLTSIFGDLNLNTSCEMPLSFSSQDPAENNMALVPAFQDNHHEMTSAPIFQSQGSFKISSMSTFESYDSYQRMTTPTLNSQGSFKNGSASTSQNHDSYLTGKASTLTSQGSFKAVSTSTSQGYDLYLTSVAPTFNSQGSFKLSSASTLIDYDSHQASTRPTFSSQNSFKFSSASTSQGHDSYQASTTSTFTPQNSFKISSTSAFQGLDSYQRSLTPIFNSQNSFSSRSTFHGHDSYQTSTASAFNSQNSFKISWASTSPSHESHHTSIVPTFYGHDSYQTTIKPTFQGHNSYTMSTASTFEDNKCYQTSIGQSFQRHNSYQTSIEPTFYTHNSYQISTEPTFKANNSYQTSLEPTLQCHNSFQTSTRQTLHINSSSQTNIDPTFHAYNSYLTSTTQSFYGNDSSQRSKETTFQTHNSYQTNTTPSFHAHNAYLTNTTPFPTFRVQDSNLSMAESTPTIATRNPNNASMVHSTFWEQNLQDAMAAPTFRANISNKPFLGATKEDDPFGPGPSSLTDSEDALNKAMQKLSLEQQKQLWLEQQKKIIGKHLN